MISIFKFQFSDVLTTSRPSIKQFVYGYKGNAALFKFLGIKLPAFGRVGTGMANSDGTAVLFGHGKGFINLLADIDRKSTRLNSSHQSGSGMPSCA